MCVSCGCKRFEDSHDDERNITVAALERAASAANLTIPQVLRNLGEGCLSMLSGGVPEHQSQGQAVHERLRPD
jgi:hypothetical protein